MGVPMFYLITYMQYAHFSICTKNTVLITTHFILQRKPTKLPPSQDAAPNSNAKMVLNWNTPKFPLSLRYQKKYPQQHPKLKAPFPLNKTIFTNTALCERDSQQMRKFFEKKLYSSLKSFNNFDACGCSPSCLYNTFHILCKFSV